MTNKHVEMCLTPESLTTKDKGHRTPWTLTQTQAPRAARTRSSQGPSSLCGRPSPCTCAGGVERAPCARSAVAAGNSAAQMAQEGKAKHARCL